MDNNIEIKIHLLSDLSKKTITRYSEQIAQWHCKEWGKYNTNLSEKDWINNILNYDYRINKIIVAVIDEQLIGSITLKKENMDNMFPHLSPWLSALYVDKIFRGKAVSLMLIKKLLGLAVNEQAKSIYVFTHTLSLKHYYEKLGWEIIQPESTAHFYYKDAPILLFKGDINILHNIVKTRLDLKQ